MSQINADFSQQGNSVFENVYITGILDYDFKKFNDIEFDSINVNDDLFVGDTSYFTGIGTFANDLDILGNLDINFLTVKKKFNVGTSGTVFTANTTDGRVGVGTTLPVDRFDISDFNNNSALVISGLGTVGIGSTNPTVNIANDGNIKLDIFGSVSIRDNIYDSRNLKGQSGQFLSAESTGITWVSFEPNFTEGIFLMDEDQYVPIPADGGTVGAGQSFTILNFIQTNSLGVGTDTLIPKARDVNTVTGLATVYTQDLWGYTYDYNAGTGAGTTIYRMTNVGIGSTIPTAQLDINGTVRATGAVEFDSSLNVIGLSTFRDSLIIQADDKFFKVQNNSGTSKFTVDTDNGNTDIKGTLDVEGVVKFTNNTGATDSSGGGALTVTGGTGIGEKLFVKGITTIESEEGATNSTSGALQVAGGVGINEKLYVGNSAYITENLVVSANTSSANKDQGALIVENGGAGIEGNLNIGGDLTLLNDKKAKFGSTGELEIYYNSTNKNTFITEGGDGDLLIQSTNLSLQSSGGENYLQATVGAGTSIFFNNLKRLETLGTGVTVTGTTGTTDLTVAGVSTFGDTVELDGPLKDINDSIADPGIGQTDYRLASVGTGVSWRPSGVQTKNAIWVSMNGDDSNSGLLEGDSKKTIGGAAAIAQAGDTIIVRSGVYYENNPVGLRTEVTISGEDLRLVTVVPNNVDKDVFHVRAGCLIQNLNFAGQVNSTNHSNMGAVAFPPTSQAVASGKGYQAVTGYTVYGPANQGPRGRYRSPYIRNCTNFMTGSVGMRIDGDYVNAAFFGTNDLGQDIKSMVCDSFTQYNENGIGVSISNNAYAQLVSIFTIGCEKAIYCDTGGQCDLTNSNSSFGIYGLVADGYGDVEFTGSVRDDISAENDIVSVNSVTDNNGNYRKPFDGQGAYFHIDLNNYNDTIATGIITGPLQSIRGIQITDGGSGYTQTSPPVVTVNAPLGPEAILPEFSANVSAAGTIASIDVVSSGRNFLPNQDINVSFSSGDATAIVDTDPILFTVESSTEPTNVGLTTITFDQFVPYSIGSGTTCEFVRLSRIITSSHSFEYVGAGTDINRANPFQGGEPIPENEIVAINGGQVPFTSTDQKGNFKIGEGLTIDQTTSTISGRDFNRAIQAQLTPLILALR